MAIGLADVQPTFNPVSARDSRLSLSLSLSSSSFHPGESFSVAGVPLVARFSTASLFPFSALPSFRLLSLEKVSLVIRALLLRG